MKRMVAMLTVLSLIGLMCAGSALAFGDQAYYANHPTSLDDLSKVWGQPVTQVSLDDGSRILVFDRHANGFPYDNRYFIIRDGRVVGGGMDYAD